MKILLYGKDAYDLEELIKKLGFEIMTKDSDKDPDVVVSYGGDGTLLFSEREFPGIPKLPIRNSQYCHKCSNHDDKKVLEHLLKGELNLREHNKLHTNIYGKDLYALNDFVVRNELPTHAIRFKVMSEASHPAPDGAGSINNLHIGDGVVISTSFGSTGYFQSITREAFEDREIFAIAFNNTTQIADPLYFEKDTEAEFKLMRGKATLTLDNSPEIFHLSEGTQLTFKLSDKVAKIYEDTSLRCPNCKVIRG